MQSKNQSSTNPALETMRCTKLLSNSGISLRKTRVKKSIMTRLRSRLGTVFGRVWEIWHGIRRGKREVEEASE